MIDPRLLLLLPVVLVAFVLKGLTGFGPGIVIVPFAALIIGAREAVLLMGLLDLTSNTAILLRDRGRARHRFWMPMAAAMVVGSLGGAALLRVVPARDYTLLLGAIFAVMGLWFVSGLRTRGGRSLCTELPPRVRPRDVGVALAAGIFGGFFGLAGLLIAWYLGAFLSKELFRRVIVHILLASALARVIAYAATGMFTAEIFLLAAGCLPLLLAGVALGGGILIRISEAWFGRVIGVILLAAAARMWV